MSRTRDTLRRTMTCTSGDEKEERKEKDACTPIVFTGYTSAGSDAGVSMYQTLIRVDDGKCLS